MDTPQFDRNKVRILESAEADPDFVLFNRETDVAYLLTFLWHFQRLNWLPPHDPDQLALLAAHDLLLHNRRCGKFYEFRLRGGRDDRKPPLTLFMHIHFRSMTVRLIGFEATKTLHSHREAILDTMVGRAGRIEKALNRSKPG